MSPTAFQAILAGISAALGTAPALAGGYIHTNQLRPIPESQGNAIVIRLDKTVGQEGVIGALDWSSDYTVECYARTAAGGDPAAAVDTLLSDTWTRLAAIDAATIGAGAIIITPQIDWQYADPGSALVCAVIHLTVIHRTSTSALQPWN